ncbi:hypothetical protein CA260_10560 [Dyella jiangningensis]|uniref:Uncharacterized protein n=1 Tax=Dyella jiangningensis TaxID=1379159 RepID=A0A328PFA5_9GAMM|nr:hypothetical protein CA260_10560 [Dyella jiangningensis]
MFGLPAREVFSGGTGDIPPPRAFDKNQLPSVDAFWSLGRYDLEGVQVAAPFDRHAVGDRVRLGHNSDGFLDSRVGLRSAGRTEESAQAGVTPLIRAAHA